MQGHDVFIHKKNMMVICCVYCLLWMVGQVSRDWAQVPQITVCIQPLTSAHRLRPASSPVTPAQTAIIELHLINVKGHPVNNIFAQKVYVINRTGINTDCD